MNLDIDAIPKSVRAAVAAAEVDDIHTHLYDPAFGPLLLWGIDDLLTYHYLVAEAFRYIGSPFEGFWKLSKQAQADLIWQQLFVARSPISEACRGVITTLNRLGLDPRAGDLAKLRQWFRNWTVEAYTTRCLELAGVRSICMTNSPFDDLERPVWERPFSRDPRFKAALRIDPLLLDWPNSARHLAAAGFKVAADFSGQTFAEIRRFLEHWSARMQPEFMMVSLPPDFAFPGNSPAARLIEHAVLPFGRERDLPFALMPGVKRAVNPGLRMAGDGVGLADLSALQNLCAVFPHNKFLCTVLARENQYELCVLARKFRNLHIFGCWWFTNIPSIIEEMTAMRLELLGLSFTPQHSDARVLDQLIYKWDHSRRVIGDVLARKFTDLARSGWPLTAAEIEHAVQQLFGGAYAAFRQMPLH